MVFSANISFRSVAFLLILFTLSFTEQKILILRKFRFISFMEHIFGVVSKKSLPNPSFLLRDLLGALLFCIFH